MKLIGSYKNGNYITAIFEDGTKIRKTDDDDFKPAFAENCDIKITNCCDMNCPMCHEASCIDGKHGNLDLPFLDNLHPYTELACLDGDTIVYTKNGIKKISELSVGDEIFDDSYQSRKIVNIKTTIKDAFLLKGDRGFSVICSKDHPFMINGEQIQAKDCVGKPFDTLSQALNTKNDTKIIFDLSKYVVKPQKDLPGSRGGRIFENQVKMCSNGLKVNRHIEINNDLMYLYGLFVAEGSRKGIVLNITEKGMAQKAVEIWKKNFDAKSKIYYHKNSLTVEFYSPKIIDAFFVDFLKVGKGARNKSLKFLYNVDNPEYIKYALFGLFDGDGCYRRRLTRGINCYSASLKTTSKELAYDVVFLLSKFFGIQASVFHSIASERKIEDRILKASDYYMVDIYGDKAFEFFKEKFVEKFGSCELHSSTYKSAKFKSIEKVGRRKLYDITLDSGSHIFPINGIVLTHNCGGGDALSHPRLIPFLEKLKKQKVIANMTVNQVHFMKNQELIKKLIDEKLIRGLGVSLVDPTDEFIETVRKYPTAVIHTINGILSESDIKRLENKDLKILILGYKNFRRGVAFLKENANGVEKKQKYLYDNLKDVIGKFKVVSFDNLAITQLDVKRLMTKEEWETFYMGDDGTMTFYIDLVNEEFASSSVSTKRYPISGSIDDMFQIVLSERN